LILKVTIFLISLLMVATSGVIAIMAMKGFLMVSSSVLLLAWCEV
jgi:hypothetical protein